MSVAADVAQSCGRLGSSSAWSGGSPTSWAPILNSAARSERRHRRSLARRANPPRWPGLSFRRLGDLSVALSW